MPLLPFSGAPSRFNGTIGGTILGGTAGSVLFINPNNILAQDNSNFFWNDSAKRLGIGAIPYSGGTQTTFQITGVNNSTSGKVITMNSDNSAFFYMYSGVYNDDPAFVWHGPNNKMRFLKQDDPFGGSGTVNLGAWDLTGLGLNNMSPTRKLDVLGIYSCDGCVDLCVNISGQTYCESVGCTFNASTCDESSVEATCLFPCVWVPNDCTIYVDETTCEFNGCTWGNCSDCASLLDQGSCETYSTCSWACNDCDVYNNDQSSCEGQIGCDWSDPDCVGQFDCGCSGAYNCSCGGIASTGDCTGNNSNCSGTPTVICKTISGQTNCESVGCTYGTGTAALVTGDTFFNGNIDITPKGGAQNYRLGGTYNDARIWLRGEDAGLSFIFENYGGHGAGGVPVFTRWYGYGTPCLQTDISYLNIGWNNGISKYELSVRQGGAGPSLPLVMYATPSSSNQLYIDTTGFVGMGIGGASSRLHVSGDTNELTAITIESSVSPSGYAALRVANNTPYLGRLISTGSSYSSGMITSNQVYIDSDAPNGMLIAAKNASGYIDFATGGVASTANRRLFITSAGRIAIGNNSSPSSMLHLPAGSATANTAPLQFTSGGIETTPRAGVMEFLTDDLYFTQTTTTNRHAFAWQDNPIPQQVFG